MIHYTKKRVMKQSQNMRIFESVVKIDIRERVFVKKIVYL